jgi:hypothetical protein
MEAMQAKEESKKLKSRLGDLGPRVAELEAEVITKSSATKWNNRYLLFEYSSQIKKV